MEKGKASHMSPVGRAKEDSKFQPVTFLYLSFVALMSSCRNWDSICSSRLHSSAWSASCKAEPRGTVSTCGRSANHTAATQPQRELYTCSSLCGELKSTGRNKSTVKSTNNRHLIHHLLPLYTLLFCTNTIYGTVWHWHCQNMFTICFMNAGSQVIDAMKYQLLTLKACSGAWIWKRWHQWAKASVALVFVTGPEVSWCLFNIPCKEPLIKKPEQIRMDQSIFNPFGVFSNIVNVCQFGAFSGNKTDRWESPEKTTSLQKFLRTKVHYLQLIQRRRCLTGSHDLKGHRCVWHWFSNPGKSPFLFKGVI